MNDLYKLEFYVPESHLEEVKVAIFAVGAGLIGNYDFCSWQVKGESQFRPLKGSNPYIGKEGKLEKLVEYKVELVCSSDKIEAVISALKKSHPYETPAYQCWKLENL